MDSDFPEALCRFIQDNVPNVDAAELLLLLSRQPNRQWKPAEIVRAIQPTAVTESAVRAHLAVFIAGGLVAKREEDCFQYSPNSAELEGVVHALAKAYNERPVTLIRAIYSLKDKRIQAFADAFKIKKD